MDEEAGIAPPWVLREESSSENVLAYHLSRSFSSHHKWSRHPEVTRFIFQKWGPPQVDFFATRQSRKCHQFCLLRRHSPSSLSDVFLISWTDHLLYAFPPTPMIHKVLLKNQTGQGNSYPDTTSMAAPALVQLTLGSLGGSSTVAPTPSGPDSQDHGWLLHPNLAFLHLTEWMLHGQACSEQVQQVLLGSRKPSIRTTYLAKWKRFACWASEHDVSPSRSSFKSILNYLLHLKQQGLAFSSIKVYLAAISAFQPPVNGNASFGRVRFPSAHS